MKRKNCPLIVFSLCILVGASCSNNASKENEGAEKSITTTANKLTETNKCLLNYASAYDALLTEDMVIQASGFSKEVMRVKYSKVLKEAKDHNISYFFSNKRMGFYPGTSTKMQLEDQIKLTGIEPLSLKEFTASYRVVTDEQLATASKVIDDAIEGKSGNEKLDNAAADLKEKGITKETTKAATNELKGVFAKAGKSYTTVEQLGDAATWNTFTNTLNVLYNGVHFELFVFVNNDITANREIAVTIARQLLQKCAA